MNQSPTKPSAAPDAAAALQAVDREIARTLAFGIAEASRLAFARSFAFAIVERWWRGRGMEHPLRPLPDAVERAALSAPAAEAAARLGAALIPLEPLPAAHILGSIYATALPEAYRGANGIYYTPPELVERLLVMAEDAGVAWESARVLDPACGGGAFLLAVAARMVDALRGTEPALVLRHLGACLRGFDVDPFGAWLAQAALEVALAELGRTAGMRLPELVEARDSLALDPRDGERFDLVIGNPPYGRVSLAKEQRARFARSVYGHANLYGLFTDAALHWVRTGGVIGYVTPTSMLSGLYYKALRALLADEAPPLAVSFVRQRDGVFADVLQETMLATYRRGGMAIPGRVGFIEAASAARVTFRKGGAFTLPCPPHSPWLLPRTAGQAMLVRRLRTMVHRLADYGYRVSTGPLVWNRHKEQYSARPVADAFPVIWAEAVSSDGRFAWRSEKRNHAPWFVARRPKDDWLIVDRPCVLVQRTTAKEQARRLIAAELPGEFIRAHKGVVIENHLNMVRPTSSSPAVPAAVIAALLNSSVVDDAFRCINGSVAVSAFELEELPLPSPATMGTLSRLVSTGAPCDRIEAVISAAYGRADAAGSD